MFVNFVIFPRWETITVLNLIIHIWGKGCELWCVSECIVNLILSSLTYVFVGKWVNSSHVNALTKSLHTSAFKPATVHLCPATAHSCPRASTHWSLQLYICDHAHLHVEAYNCAVVPTCISAFEPATVYACSRVSPRSSPHLHLNVHDPSVVWGFLCLQSSQAHFGVRI